MKRSLFIAIAVLLIAALFVSCNADKIEEDQLVTVTIASDVDRGLQAEGQLNINVEDLYWYYTAKKTSGIFTVGQKLKLTPVIAEGTKGIADASFTMSKGGWEFCFFGFKAVEDASAEVPTTTAILYQEGLKKTIAGDVALDITLVRGQGTIDSSLSFENIEWNIGSAAAGLLGEITLEVSLNDDKVVYENIATTTSTDGKAKFTGVYPLTGTGTATVSFVVYNTFSENGTTLKEKVGEDNLELVLSNGIQYIVTHTGDGITVVETGETAIVTPGDISQPLSETKGFTVKSTGPTTVAATAANTSVEFPAESGLAINTSHTLSVGTIPRATVESNPESFVVAAGTTGVAAIDLTLDNASSSSFDAIVKVTTKIEAGLPENSVKVFFNGSETFTIGTQEYNYFVDYDPDGTLIFQTNHFSQYVIAIDCVATIGDKAYGSLEAAVADVPTNGIETIIKLQKNADGNGIKVVDGKNIVFDLNGKTYNVTGKTVGSTGTETQAFQLLKGSTVTFKNGKITSTTAKMLIQNYCNLTLEDVELDGTHLPGSGQYVLSGNNGDILITGETNITAKEGDFAFDVCYTNYYPDGVRYLFDDNYVGTVTGTIQLDVWRSKPAETKCKLTIKAGTFNGAFDIQSALQDEALNDIIILGGTFNGVEPVAFVNGAVYGSLMDAIDSVAKNATATIVLLNDVADGSGLSTDSRGADSYPKNLTIDFNGKTYTMKDPAVGSTNTQTQAMHWAAGSTIVMKNGTFAVQADAINVKMGMQNYAALTIKDMVLDFRAVPAGHYGNTYTGNYAKYNGLEMPIFNHVGTATGAMTLKNSTVLAGDNNSFSVYTEGDLYLDNCTFNKPIALSSDGAPKAYVISGTYEFAPYFAGDEVINDGDYYTVQTASN